MKARYLRKRNEVFYFRRIVPLRLRAKFGKNEVLISLDTRNYSVALGRLSEYSKKYDALFEGSADNDDFKNALAMEDVKEMGRVLGFEYQHFDPKQLPSLADAITFLAPRIDALAQIRKPTRLELASIAGLVKETLTIDEAIKRYKDLSRDSWMNLSGREREKKLNPIDSAGRDFSSEMDDHDVLTLSKSDVYRYRETLLARVGAGELKAATANKKLMHLRKVITKVFEVDHPNLANPFEKVRILDGHPMGKREPFTESEITELSKFLAESDANDQLKAIIVVGMFTGAACKEIVLLDPATDIILDADVPHIRVFPNIHRNKVKSGGSRHREIPILGEAMIWLKKHPKGFPRYCRDNGSEAVSAAANKLISKVCKKTFYSFRHRVADLLRNAGVQDSLKDAILGHSTPGMGAHYGKGFTLEMKQIALRAAFKIS